MKPERPPKKYADELRHASVASWYNHLRERSPDTADSCLRRVVHGLCEGRGVSPAHLLSLGQEELDREVATCVNRQLERGLQESTVSTWLRALSSFLKWNGRALQHTPHIPHARRFLRTENEEIPSQEDLARVLAAGLPRSRATVSLIAFSGLRPIAMCLGNTGQGLRLRNLPDLEVGPDRIAFRRMPARIDIPRGLDKHGTPHFTFLAPEGCRHLLAYLHWRREQGEELGPDSPLLTPMTGKPRFCSRSLLWTDVHRVMRSVGLSQRVYVWRSYFANRCMMAEPHGFPESWRRFFMGHSGDVQTTYALRKHLPSDTIEAMRDAYAKALPYLESKPPPARDESDHP